MTSSARTSVEPPASLTAEPDRFSDDAWELLLAGQDLARRWRHGELDVEHLLQVLFSDRRYGDLVGALSLDPEELLDRLEGFLADQPMARGDELFIGDDLEDLLEQADRQRALWGSRLIEVSHLLMAMGRDPRVGAELFERLGLPADRLEAEVRQWRPAQRAVADQVVEEREPGADPVLEEPRRSMSEAPLWASAEAPAAPSSQEINRRRGSRSAPPSSMLRVEVPRVERPRMEPQPADAAPLETALEEEPMALDLYGRDLTAAAAAGTLDPVIGRDTEIRRLIKVLSRRGKNNPVLIGALGWAKPRSLNCWPSGSWPVRCRSRCKGCGLWRWMWVP